MNPARCGSSCPRPAARDAGPAGHVRIGYARTSTVRQLLDTQLDALRAAGVSRIFSEKISTRITVRPELDKAVHLAREVAPSGVAVTLVVHEHKRLGRGLEPAALAEQLKAAGVGLQFLTGELQGSHDSSGVVFTVLAALSGMEREYIRDKTLDGHKSARTRGKNIGGASVTDDHMLSMAAPARPGAAPARHRLPARHQQGERGKAGTRRPRRSCACCASTTRRALRGRCQRAADRSPHQAGRGRDGLPTASRWRWCGRHLRIDR